MGHPWGALGTSEMEAAKPAKKFSRFARFDTAGYRGFLNFLLAIVVTYVVAFGFILILGYATMVVNTQYIPSAQENPFASGILLAGAVVGLVWWMTQRRRA